MSSKSRSKLLALSLVGLLGCAALIEGFNSWQSPWALRRSQIDALRAELQQQVRRLQRRQEQSQSLRRWSKMALPFDEAKAAAVYYPYLTQLTEACGLTQVSLTPTAADQDAAEVGGLRLTLTAEAGVDAWDRFFQAVRATPALQQILRWDLQAGGDANVLGSVVLEAVRYQGAAEPESAFVSPQTIATATVFGERNWFGDRGLFATDESVDAAVEPTADEPSSITFTLIGIYGDARDGEAWLYDAQSKSQLVLQRDRTFEIGNRRGTVAAVDLEGLTVILDGRKQRLHLGDRLQ